MFIGNLLNSSSNLNQPYEYVGREGYYREEFDLYLLGVRWYDSSVGRFISRDPIGEGILNLYIYSGNNCLNFVDATGLFRIYPDSWAIIPKGLVFVPDQSCGKCGKIGMRAYIIAKRVKCSIFVIYPDDPSNIFQHIPICVFPIGDPEIIYYDLGCVNVGDGYPV